MLWSKVHQNIFMLSMMCLFTSNSLWLIFSGVISSLVVDLELLYSCWEWWHFINLSFLPWMKRIGEVTVFKFSILLKQSFKSQEAITNFSYTTFLMELNALTKMSMLISRLDDKKVAGTDPNDHPNTKMFVFLNFIFSTRKS